MHLFYTPDINSDLYTLNPEESNHAVRVLRMGEDDELFLTDGNGTLFKTIIVHADARKCVVKVVETIKEYHRRDYSITMCVAPTKNIDRFEWFIEKATEIGVDTIIPMECKHSERRIVKEERLQKIITSAAKQSLKTYYPKLLKMTPIDSIINSDISGEKIICCCDDKLASRKFLSELLLENKEYTILIGPEGDFSQEEVESALKHGFKAASLGEARLRVETAAITAVITTAIVNQ